MTIALHSTPTRAHVDHLQKIHDAISTLSIPKHKTVELYTDLGVQSTFDRLVQSDVETATTLCQAIVDGLSQISLDHELLICSTAMLAECYLATGKHDEVLLSA